MYELRMYVCMCVCVCVYKCMCVFTHARAPTHTARLRVSCMYEGSALFWYIRQSTVVLQYRRSGTTYRIHLLASRRPSKKLLTITILIL